jgi:hypothetical protein
VGDTEETIEIPAFLGIRLFTNGAMHAGLAVTHLKVEDTDTPYASAWDVWLSRYQVDVGWQAPTTRGEGCNNSTSTSYVGVCTQRPSGAITSSGDSVVVFPSEDSSGVVRLNGVAFK